MATSKLIFLSAVHHRFIAIGNMLRHSKHNYLQRSLSIQMVGWTKDLKEIHTPYCRTTPGVDAWAV